MYKNLLSNLLKSILLIITVLVFFRPIPVLAQLNLLPSDYNEKQYPKTKTKTPTPTPYVPLQKYQPDYILKSVASKYFSDQYISQYSNSLPKLQVLSLSIVGVCLFLIGLFLGIKYWLFKRTLLRDRENGVFLEIKPPAKTSQSAFSTEQLFKVLHTQGQAASWWERFFNIKRKLSLEIVSTKEQGIRYIIQTSKKDALVIEKDLLSYLAGIKVTRVSDYLPKDFDSLKGKNKQVLISEFELSNHFSIPLQDQKVLDHSDPIAYITGHMTKLASDELISMQIVLTPITSGFHNKIIKTIQKLLYRIENGLEIKDIIDKKSLRKRIILIVFKLIGLTLFLCIWIIVIPLHLIMYFTDRTNEIFPALPFSFKPKKVLKTPQQEKLYQEIQGKIEGSLFETSMRLVVIVNTKESSHERSDGFVSALSTFTNPSLQSLSTQREWTEKFWNLLDFISRKNLFYKFLYFKLKNRLLSFHTSSSPVLSVSEIADLYHLPYTDTTKTEGLVKSRSRELPAPLSLKKSDTNFDVVVGVNQYGGEVSPIGLTLEQRQKHMYVIGKTGTGKTTLLTSSIYQDMESGKGLAVFDPHGDMIQELLRIIPKNRIKDVIFFDPSDRGYPIGLNLLSPGIKFSNEEDGQEWITSSVLAVFKKLADEQYWGPRMEHILRNATLTALQTPNPNLYTLQRLLTDKKYQKQVAATLKDAVLKQFWQKELALMGTMQLSSVTAPLTQRLGSFISSKMSRHILLQGKSTISISQIMDEGKILLVNLSKGDLGEDQSFFFGTILTSFIWMAAYQRTKIPEKQRRDFFLYVDEFQNFATPRFSEITSEGRKFHVSLIASHQNIAQVKDQDILKVVAGNANTIICLKASPDDEKFILPFMDPEVEKGDIVNLSPYHFFMKVTTDESEDAFSGKTVPIDVKSSEKTKDEVIAYTREHYALPRTKVEQYLEKLFAEDTPKSMKQKITKESKNPKKTNTLKAKTTMAKKPARRK